MTSGKISSAFNNLHPKIQRWIWKMGWKELRDIQEESVEPILECIRDLIITATTAGGKTEAAYLPICSYILSNSAVGFRVLYLSPLKALINDQFERLRELCSDLNIQVHRWHGDVSSSAKKKLINNPNGILMITPESLEAIFVNHGYRVVQVFSGVSYIIIDELHNFLGAERGYQLLSLLNRLEIAIRKKVVRIGLSATLGDMSIAADYLRPNMGKDVVLIKSTNLGKEIKLQVRGYKIPDIKIENVSALNDEEKQIEMLEEGSDFEVARHLFKFNRGSSNLIFANRRDKVELFADILRNMSAEDKVPNEFYPHHGSLSKDLREFVEDRIKKSNSPTNIVATTTLELGIDIGNVVSISQIGCAGSVSSMRQRLGRSGRRDDDPSIMRIFIQEMEITERTPPQDRLRSELFQTTAMVEKLIEGWCEPPEKRSIHISTLVQQVLSLIAQYGGIKAKDIWNVLAKGTVFEMITQDQLIQLLRYMGEKKLIHQTHDESLVLGTIGERIVNHYSFYTVFKTPEEFRLMSNGKTLGCLPISSPIQEGYYLVFGGRRWQIKSINLDQKVIDLIPAKGGRPPIFSGGGAFFIHDEIRKKMLQLYSSDYIPSYLNNAAMELFVEGRDNFKDLVLSQNHIIQYGNEVIIFPWKGDKIMNTLQVIFSSAGLKVYKDGISLTFSGTDIETINGIIKKILSNPTPDPIELAASIENKENEKYDLFVPEHLLCVDYALRNLDIDGAYTSLPHLCKSTNS
jgi:ATP-dependent helicase Lhr and Lhr-like helicase